MTLKNASLDLFTTDILVAGQCCRDMFETMRIDGADPTQYRWIEPSAGKGPFLKRLPPDTIALDVLPRHPNIVRAEFLTWRPPHRDRYAIIGSPPFGIRARQSIPFLNHALEFADYVGMIVLRSMTKSKVNGRLIRFKGLDMGAMRGLSGNVLPLRLEWQVWSRTGDMGWQKTNVKRRLVVDGMKPGKDEDKITPKLYNILKEKGFDMSFQSERRRRKRIDIEVALGNVHVAIECEKYGSGKRAEGCQGCRR